MPLLRIDLQEGKSNKELQSLLDILHENVVSAFNVPKNDRYQIITQHSSNEMILLDTGLGFDRDPGEEIVITVFSRKRNTKAKELFYHSVAQSLQKELGIDPKNLLITVFENSDADWSFGYGNAQFLTGELT